MEYLFRVSAPRWRDRSP